MTTNEVGRVVRETNYRIASDHTGGMNRLLMNTSSSFGLPTSFVVDRDGRIAFICHPARLDDVLSKVLKSIWRSSDEAKLAERIAENERRANELAETESIYANLAPAMKTEDWTAALLVVGEGTPSLTRDRLTSRPSIGPRRD
ncbi:hypothetical protein [Bradyrhizobium sp. Ec3.3]|uniref:hypothetical protein n=1 Tax=Bradyrhizobium sp. Ec3.3 TaxID=189753 RepID=UPI0012EC1C05|nr:hypothetical protein [Bradyrhizobium sp. Ec3.3]